MNRKLLGYSLVVVAMFLLTLSSPSFAQYWSEMDSGTEQYIWGVWGTSSTNVYAVAGKIAGEECVILHYDGISWPDMGCIASERLEGIWGSSENDIFVVGNGGTILHSDGYSWEAMESGTTVDLTDVWVNAENDAFAVGL